MLLAIYTVILVTAVLLGSATQRIIASDHRRTQLVMSFVSGILLGIAVFHLIPHAVYTGYGQISVDYVAYWIMAGLIGIFLLQRLFHFHQHDFEDDYTMHHTANRSSSPSAQKHPKSAIFSRSSGLNNVGLGVFLGLSVHSVIDGIALAAAMQLSHQATHDIGSLAGIGVFIAILLHKPLDALTIDIFLRRAGVGGSLRWLILIGYALICPLVAALLMAGYDMLGADSTAYVVAALAFSAGMFLCISLSDLLPEIHFHSHDRLSMTVALLVGIALSLALKYLESDHSHQPRLDHVLGVSIYDERGHAGAA